MKEKGLEKMDPDSFVIDKRGHLRMPAMARFRDTLFAPHKEINFTAKGPGFGVTPIGKYITQQAQSYGAKIDKGIGEIAGQVQASTQSAHGLETSLREIKDLVLALQTQVQAFGGRVEFSVTSEAAKAAKLETGQTWLLRMMVVR
jgi:hypothetical protein